MPHIVIEHSKVFAEKVDMQELCEGLHRNLSANEGLKLAATKTRSVLVDNVYVGESPYHQNFVHITISLLTRFDDEGKRNIAKMMQKKAEEITEGRFTTCNITVEVRDLQGYVKSN